MELKERCSQEANVYVESKSPIYEESIPPLVKAAKVYKNAQVAKDLRDVERFVSRISEISLKKDYESAYRVFKQYIVLVYNILSSNGGITREEWDFMATSISKSNYIFPDVVQKLGTNTKWKLPENISEIKELIKKILKEENISFNLISKPTGKILYENDVVFIKELESKLKVKKIFEEIEKNMDSADYVSTKQRLHYLSIYDFLNFHCGENVIPTKENLLKILTECDACNSAKIIASRSCIERIDSGRLWDEYETYREFKIIRVLARWYAKSTVRQLNGQAYEYFKKNIRPETLSKALALLKIHTAYLDTQYSKSSTKGNQATFEFKVEQSVGELYLTCCKGSYAQDFFETTSREQVAIANGQTSVTVSNLFYTKKYYASIWEIIDGEATKLGDLPVVVPAIRWPTLNGVSKSGFANQLKITLKIGGGEGNLSYWVHLKDGNSSINRFKEGMMIRGTDTSEGITFSVEDLTYGKEYTICVFVALDGGKYTLKIVDDFIYEPQETKMTTVVRLPVENAYSFTAVPLNFKDGNWPFENNSVVFACRTDRVPESPEDTQSGLMEIPFMTEDGYNSGEFKIRIKKKTVYEVIYIRGWIYENGKPYLVVDNAIYDIMYSVIKKNILKLDSKFASIYKLPKLRVYCFDRKDNIIFQSNDVVFDANNQYQMNPTKTIKSIVVETAEEQYRQIYQFRSSKTMLPGKNKVAFF